MNIEQIKQTIAEQKHKTTVINNAGVEWENLKVLLNYILNTGNREVADFMEACKLSVILCDDMKDSLEKIKETLPKE